MTGERPKPFAALDVDGTIFKSSLLEKVVDVALEEKMMSPRAFDLAFETKRLWQDNNKEGTYQAYIDRLINAFIEQMNGATEAELTDVTKKMMRRQKDRRFGFPRRLIRAVRTSHTLIALSHSPNSLVAAMLEDLNFDRIEATRYHAEEGVYTGKVELIGDKGELLNRLVNEGAVSQLGSIAIGDTFTDRTMLAIAERPVAFNPSRTLTDYARIFGWPRVMESKDQVTVIKPTWLGGDYTEIDDDVFLEELRRPITATIQ